MNKLPESQYVALIAAIRREPHTRAEYEKATRTISFGSAIRPRGTSGALTFPRSLAEWRLDPEASIKLVNRHQEACDRAWRMYWESMSHTQET